MKKKRKNLFLILVSFIFIFTSNFTFAQDPGDPDTVWLSSVTMSQVYIFGFFADSFAIECSVWTDDSLAAFVVPISFYHSQNLDIICDSVVWDTFVTSHGPDLLYPAVDNPADSDVVHSDSVVIYNYTPKAFSANGSWFTDGLPPTKPGRRRLFTAWFHAFGNWENSKSIVLDSVAFRPPTVPHPRELIFVRTSSTGTEVPYAPIFYPGVIGDTVVISGTVFKTGRSTPDSGVSVYCRGKDVTTYPNTFPGRVLEDITDESGNFRFVVGKGGYWCVFRDTSGAMVPGSNAYCFDSLVSDTSGLNFNGYTDVEEEKEKDVTIPERFVLFQNYPNPFNPYTLIRFALPEDCEVKLEVYNILGQKVKTLIDGFFTKGVREVVWDGKNQKGREVASGIYFYRIKTKKYTESKKMVFLR